MASDDARPEARDEFLRSAVREITYGTVEGNPRPTLNARECRALNGALGWYAMAVTDRATRIAELEARLRKAAQILIESIGAEGPEDVEVTAARAVGTIAGLQIRAEAAEARVAELEMEMGKMDDALAAYREARGA